MTFSRKGSRSFECDYCGWSCVGSFRMKRHIDEQHPVFIVDKILCHRRRTGGLEYLVRWMNFAPEHDFWEPANNLEDAQESIDRYWDRHDSDIMNTVVTAVCTFHPGQVISYDQEILMDVTNISAQ